MKVTFVYPDIVPHVLDWSGYFHYGIGSLSAILKASGHATSLIHVSQPMLKSVFIEQLQSGSPDLIAFSSTSHMFPQVRQFAQWLREDHIHVPTIYGGMHPTIAPEESLALNGIDMICRGEGEDAMAELCDLLEQGRDSTTIRNLWVKSNGNVIRNPLRPVIEDLDQLPFADREIYDYPRLYHERHGMACFMASRGCPFNCTYCCNQLKRSIYGTNAKPVRKRSVDNVLREIKQVVQAHPFIERIAFDDDILFLNKKWSREFAARYKSEIGLPFMCNARADVTDEATVGLLRDAGCYYVKLGLENGSQDLRYNVLNRHMTNEQIATAFRLCKEAGMITHAYNIVGIPRETPRTMMDTVKMNAKIGVDITHVSIFQPYPGTKLHQVCRSEGLLDSETLPDDIFSSSVLKLKDASVSQVLMFRDYFRAFMWCYRLLWRLPKRISKSATRLLERCLAAQCTATVLNAVYLPCNYLYRRIGLVLNFRHTVAK